MWTTGGRFIAQSESIPVKYCFKVNPRSSCQSVSVENCIHHPQHFKMCPCSSSTGVLSIQCESGQVFHLLSGRVITDHRLLDSVLLFSWSGVCDERLGRAEPSVGVVSEQIYHLESSSTSESSTAAVVPLAVVLLPYFFISLIKKQKC